MGEIINLMSKVERYTCNSLEAQIGLSECLIELNHHTAGCFVMVWDDDGEASSYFMPGGPLGDYEEVKKMVLDSLESSIKAAEEDRKSEEI